MALSTPEERARDRTAERYAAARRRLSLAHHRIATGAATTAIQQRYMRAVRRTGWLLMLGTRSHESPPSRLLRGPKRFTATAF